MNQLAGQFGQMGVSGGGEDLKVSRFSAIAWVGIQRSRAAD